MKRGLQVALDSTEPPIDLIYACIGRSPDLSQAARGVEGRTLAAFASTVAAASSIAFGDGDSAGGVAVEVTVGDGETGDGVLKGDSVGVGIEIGAAVMPNL